MDAATASDKHEARPASGGASTTAASVREARGGPLPEPAVAGGSGCGEAEDEQVERFYALLANIRALRDVYGPAGGSSRKRARVAEPPWRPRFRMEDFRAADGAAVPMKKERRCCVQRRRPENDGDDAAADQDGEVVEENDRVSASRSTRACTGSAKLEATE